MRVMTSELPGLLTTWAFNCMGFYVRLHSTNVHADIYDRLNLEVLVHGLNRRYDVTVTKGSKLRSMKLCCLGSTQEQSLVSWDVDVRAAWALLVV